MIGARVAPVQDETRGHLETGMRVGVETPEDERVDRGGRLGEVAREEGAGAGEQRWWGRCGHGWLTRGRWRRICRQARASFAMFARKVLP
jgi:hypothetical protein